MLYRPNETHPKDRIQQKSTRSSHLNNIQHGRHHRPALLLIPGESLTHITSFLDPPSLLALERTNKLLQSHVGDDNTWHRAFVYQFLDIGPETDLQDAKSLILRRSESTWRKEFIIRYNLRRRWERSRNPTITHVPHHSVISTMHLMPEQALLTASIQYGVVSRSLPLTGKILRGYLDASGTGLGIGNPNAEFTPNISACALSSDGGTAKVLWGFRNGQVAVTTSSKAMDSTRATAKFVKCKVNEEHEGAVQDISWDASMAAFVSGALDGRVKLWDAKSAGCIWTFDRKLVSLVPDACIQVQSELSRGVVVGAMKSGMVVVWTGLSRFLTEEIPEASYLSVREFRIPFPIPRGDIYDDSQTAEISSLYLDHSTPSHVAVLTSYINHPFFYRSHINLATGLVSQTQFGDDSFGPITALKPMFSTLEQESSFVITGDQLGCINIHDWDASPSSGLGKPVLPIRKFEAHDDSAINTIAWNSVTLVTGSARGTVRVFDALTFAPLRAFSAPGPRPTTGTEWEPVSGILLERELVVVSIGSKIMAWKAGAVGSDKTNTKRVHGKKTKRGGTAKWHQQLELHRDIVESRRDLEQERVYTQRIYGREREQRSTLEHLGLDEVEAVEYVLMLSRDEEEQRRFSTATPLVEEGIFEADFDDIPNTATLDDTSAQAIAPSSRSSSGTYQIGRSPPRVASFPSNHKIQVSPRFRPEPVEAGPSISPLNIGSSRTVLPTADEFPVMSASPSSTSPGASWVRRSVSGSPESSRSAWSTPRRSTPTSVVPSPGSSPHFSRAASSTARPPAESFSLLSAEIVRSSSMDGNVSIDGEGDMDDDLRFAIQISLAEARSRGEV